MGREIKRVALDFDYPINKMIWKGYHNPYSGLECGACEGTGYSPAAKQLKDTWYNTGNSGEGWCHNITQDEVQALVDEGRLMDFTRVPKNEEQEAIVKEKIASGGNSWLPHDNGYIPTPDEVNEWSRRGFGHDCINMWICLKARAARLGIGEMHCAHCDGEGVLWPDVKYQQLAEDFERVEPPSGEGYQLWSTTSEGTPMSPVFKTPEMLASWLTDTGASSFGRNTASFEEWLKFIQGPGWAPSAIIQSGDIKPGVTAL